jgi:hypothetical protein
MNADGQEQKLACQIDGHCNSPIWNKAPAVTRPNFTIPQSKVFSPNAPHRHCELSLCCLVWPQVGRQLVVEPQQIML